MGRPPNVPKDEAIALIEKFIDHFRSEKIPQFSNPIWTEMSAAIDNRWNPHVLYNNVNKDLRGILTEARKKCNVEINNNVDMNDTADTTLDETMDSSESFNDLDTSYEFEERAKELDHFKLVIPRAVWTMMRSSAVTYSDGRLYNVLNKDQWTDILSILIFEQTRLPCGYAFHHGKLYQSPDSLHHVRIDGHCMSKTCRNLLFCYIKADPGDSDEIEMTMRTRETFWDTHEKVHRPLRGFRRQTAGKDIYYMGAGNWQKREGGFYAQFGGSVGPNVPTMSTARQAKNEYINKKLDVKPTDGKDVVMTIEMMKYTPPYNNFIREVRRDKFYVSYFAHNQMHAYNQYCRKMKQNATPAVDGTGSLIKKIRRLDGTLTGHIFLYSVTINYMGRTISVYDCLTESQDTDSLAWWLGQWLKYGATVPPQMNCDRSRALMNAICKAFNEQTLNVYNETLSLLALGNPEGQRRPVIRTYIRNDVAHLMIMVAKWDQFKKINFTTVRQFYLYCIGLMIDAQTIEQFREIFLLTLTVGMQKSEEAISKAFPGNTVASCKEKLENYIAHRNYSFELAQVEELAEVTILCEDDYKNDNSVNETNQLKNWIDDLKRQAEYPQNCSKNEIGTLNVRYCKEFMDRLVELAYEFPLWTGAAVPCSSERASTAFMEGHFNDVKNRVNKNDPGLSRADKFTKRMYENNTNGASLFTSDLPDSKMPQESRAQSDNPGLKRNPHCTQRNQRAQSSDSGCEQSNPSSQISNADEGDNSDSSDSSPLLRGEDIGKVLKEKTREGLLQESNVQRTSQSKEKPATNMSQEFFTEHDDFPSSPRNDEQFFTFRSSSNNVNVPSSTEEAPCSSMDSTHQGRKRSLSAEMKMPQDAIEFDSNKKRKIDLQKSTKNQGKYFTPRPDIAHRNTLSINIKKSSLLWNGNKKNTRVYIKGRNTGPFYATNTCSFDSITQIISGALMDDPNYRKSVQSSGEMFQFLLSFVQNGATKGVYEQRVRLLQSLFPDRVTHHESELGSLGSHEIYMFTFLRCVWGKCFKNDPSMVYSYICNKCGQYSSDESIVPVNVNLIKANGFTDLENAIHSHSKPRAVPCSRKSCSQLVIRQCGGFGRQIFVELDVRRDITDKVGLGCQLGDFPKYMTLANHQFRLAGVVGGPSGHFIGYCWRVSDKWDVCDDLQAEVKHVNPSFKLIPQGVIYVRIASEDEVSKLSESSPMPQIDSPVLTNPQASNTLHGTPDVSSSPEPSPNSEVFNIVTDERMKLPDLYCTDNWRNKGTHDFYWMEENDKSSLEETLMEQSLSQNEKNSGISQISRSRPGICMPAMRLDDETFRLAELSSFDAVIHVLLCTAMDNVNYEKFSELSLNKILTFCQEVLETDCTEAVNQNRKLLFVNLFQSGLSSAETNKLKNMWDICFIDEPSVWKTFDCKSCEKYAVPTTHLTVDKNCIINKGFNALQEAVQFNGILKKVPCRQKNCRKLCSVSCTVNSHLFIDLDVKTRNRAKTNLTCKLESIPKNLDLEGILYRLSGVIAFTDNRYVAYCFRSTDRWELYDGYSTSKTMDLLDVIEPYGAVYVKPIVES